MKTHINGNTIEQLMTNVVTLTQAQYDALPLEQKNHGTYIISDADSPNINAEDVDYDSNTSVKDKIDTKVDKETDKRLVYALKKNIAGGGSITIPAQYMPIEVLAANNSTTYNMYRVLKNSIGSLTTITMYEINTDGVKLSFSLSQDETTLTISNSGVWGAVLFITGYAL